MKPLSGGVTGGPKHPRRHTYLYNGVVQVLLDRAGTVALQPKEKRKMKPWRHVTQESRGDPRGTGPSVKGSHPLGPALPPRRSAHPHP